MKTVFIVLREVKYESDDIMCVFNNEQSAEEYADQCKINNKQRDVYYSVVEYELLNSIDEV